MFSALLDDVFLPKDIDLDSVDIDETEREVECFKRCPYGSIHSNLQLSLCVVFNFFSFSVSDQVLLGLCSTDKTETVHQLVQLQLKKGYVCGSLTTG